MDDERAKDIADLYIDNIRQAHRIGVSQGQAPFVAVCLTIGDILSRSILEMKLRSLHHKINRVRIV